jgi:hypothetical protein
MQQPAGAVQQERDGATREGRQRTMRTTTTGDSITASATATMTTTMATSATTVTMATTAAPQGGLHGIRSRGSGQRHDRHRWLPRGRGD